MATPLFDPNQFKAHHQRGFDTAAHGMHLFRLGDGKIIEHWAVRDDLGMLQQLGLVSLPG